MLGALCSPVGPAPDHLQHDLPLRDAWMEVRALFVVSIVCRPLITLQFVRRPRRYDRAVPCPCVGRKGAERCAEAEDESY